MGGLVFDKITLTGFKSFVEPTDFLIEPGLTGVVGPNGCGKSNLLEAIRWVMGANSAKAMRGAQMEDVIFSGTKQRPGRNQAHVTLHIDNSARVAPATFNDSDQLEVMRVIVKGKGSTYKINGKTVRAKDVQLLFADASTGANSPALVRQNQISELISAKPANRRRVLEEAAGISGLHSRRHEAELRLRAAETNLDRLEDIVAQIESQLLSLRRQSRQAARYKRLAGEIHEYRALLWRKRWVAALDTLAGAQDALKACDANVQDTALRSAEAQRIAADLSGGIKPLQEEQLIAAAVLARINAAKDALESEEKAATSELRKLEAQIEQLSADIDRESGIVEDAQAAETRLEVEHDNLAAAGDQSAALDEARDEAEAALRLRNTIEADMNELTAQIAGQTARAESAARELEQAERRLSVRQRELQDAERALTALSADNGGSASLFAASAREALDALNAAKAAERNAATKRNDADEADQQARESLSDAKAVLGELTSERSALERIVNRGGSDHATALSLITVQKGYERALAAALGEDLDAGIGGRSALRWTGAPDSDQRLPPGATPLSQLVSGPVELTARLGQIGVTESAAELADQLKPGQRLVTRNGYVVRWDGFVTEAGAETAASVKLKQQGRLQEMASEIEAAEASVADAKLAFERARAHRDLARDMASQARAALPELERKERAAQAALSQYETDVARETAQRRSLEERIERLQAEIAELRQQRDAAKASVDGADHDDSLGVKRNALAERLLDARADADETNTTYRSLRNAIDARTARLKAVESERADWQRRRDQAADRVATLQGRLDAARINHQGATDGPDRLENRRTALFAQLEEAEQRRDAAADTLSGAETSLRDAEIAARDLERAAGQARESRAAAEARLVAAKERIGETKARINETLQCNPSELNEHLGSLSPDSDLSEADIERKLERLAAERERLGSVNLRADEEAAEQEETLSTLTKEREDLVKAIAKLREGIDELNTEGRQKLLAAFDVVNGHFSKLFVTLFGGGEAWLSLTESDDPLEAGLEVFARPPGKTLKPMSLLSGGEQALTATALIFAVFLSNPAPVCVLDEVDAPLDDYNVGRYCDVLDEMSRLTDTKFIAITHNPVTMSRMDRLFGVTMAEQGVSQLLSVELARAEALVAAE
ncbi:AAA family ATPase [uncultured Algimonas sp.]|uniref:AAA family ATPase n=1 Tax=uncultured Algimonas sp. TaxID=1547920 RepID=UPI002626A9DB|nr:AAA family ATPase [uncultured Algimonas sp.]